MTSILRSLLWILAGALILLAPAIVWGRPFVFYDTPAYWGWGRDIFEALLRPWPHGGQAWVAGRPLHGWEIGAHGATAGDLRFTLTLLSARSAFYALPFYLLSRTGGLWLVAALQAATASWTVHVASRALAPAMPGRIYLAIMVVLAAATSLGFEAAYAMPDLFGGLALLAAAVMIAYPERLARGPRLGLCAVMAYAALAHSENGLNLAAAAGLCLAMHLRGGRAAVVVRTAPIAAALGVALAIGAGGGLLLNVAFGRPLQMAPFAASRVLADGTGQAYLRETCARAPLAACDLAASPPAYPEYYLGVYPLDPPPSAPPSDPAHMYDKVQFRAVSDAEAAHRERFVAEQGRLVIGAIATDGLGEIRAALANGAAAFMNFGVNRDFDSLQGLMREHTQRRDQIVAITPGAPDCPQSRARACGALQLGAIAPLQAALVWTSFAFLGVALFRKDLLPGGELRTFAAASVCLVLVNALLCGGLSGPYDRYQSRVEWLVPLCAMLAIVQWALRRTADARSAAPAATFPSPVGPIVSAPAAVRRP